MRTTDIFRASVMVQAFSALRSLQGCQLLPFLGTIYSAEDHKLSKRQAVPSRNMASNFALAIAS
jgi:hypothetical protein